MTQEIIKLLHPEFEPFRCEECKEEISLPISEIKRLCLLADEDLKHKKLKGLCPTCTRKVIQRQSPEKGRGYSAAFVTLDEIAFTKKKNGQCKTDRF